MKYCELNETKICDDCGQCEICDLNKNKICDDCCACLGLDPESDYKAIEIEDLDDGVEYDFTDQEGDLFFNWMNKNGK